MNTRLRRTGLASAAALSLVLAASGLAAASHFTLATRPAADTQDPAVDPAPVVDTTATWEDVDGNGVDDDCQTTPAMAEPTAAGAADLAADLNGDGVLSQPEAAQSGRIGGTNCNHGGYVSAMAHAKHDCTTPPPAEPTDGDSTEPTTPTDATLTLATDDEQGEDAGDNEQGDDDQGEDADDQGEDAQDQGDQAEQGEDAEDQGDQGDEAKAESGDSASCDADTKVSDHEAAKEARTAAHDAAKAEREAKHAEAKAAREAAKADRQATKAAAHAKHAKHANHGKSHSH